MADAEVPVPTGTAVRNATADTIRIWYRNRYKAEDGLNLSSAFMKIDLGLNLDPQLFYITPSNHIELINILFELY